MFFNSIQNDQKRKICQEYITKQISKIPNQKIVQLLKLWCSIDNYNISSTFIQNFIQDCQIFQYYLKFEQVNKLFTKLKQSYQKQLKCANKKPKQLLKQYLNQNQQEIQKLFKRQSNQQTVQANGLLQILKKMLSLQLFELRYEEVDLLEEGFAKEKINQLLAQFLKIPQTNLKQVSISFNQIIQFLTFWVNKDEKLWIYYGKYQQKKQQQQKFYESLNQQLQQCKKQIQEKLINDSDQIKQNDQKQNKSQEKNEQKDEEKINKQQIQSEEYQITQQQQKVNVQYSINSKKNNVKKKKPFFQRQNIIQQISHNKQYNQQRMQTNLQKNEQKIIDNQKRNRTLKQSLLKTIKKYQDLLIKSQFYQKKIIQQTLQQLKIRYNKLQKQQIKQKLPLIQLNQRSNIKNIRIGMNRLVQIYQFYCKKVSKLNKFPTFESIKKQSNCLNLYKFMSFCRDFQLLKLLSRNQLILYYKKGGKYLSQINFNGFIQVLKLIAQRLYKAAQPITQLINYLKLDNELYCKRKMNIQYAQKVLKNKLYNNYKFKIRPLNGKLEVQIEQELISRKKNQKKINPILFSPKLSASNYNNINRVRSNPNIMTRRIQQIQRNQEKKKNFKLSYQILKSKKNQSAKLIGKLFDLQEDDQIYLKEYNLKENNIRDTLIQKRNLKVLNKNIHY